MKGTMNRVIIDDAEVEALARKLGAWHTIAESIANGRSGVLVSGHWVIAYYEDGLGAVEASNPVERAMLAALMGAPINGPMRAGFASPSWPTTH